VGSPFPPQRCSRTVLAVKDPLSAPKEARQKVREELTLKAEGALAELRAIGFDYELVEKNGKPKMGRPRKETNGKVRVAQNA
jgi:hypothetical protein